MRSECESNKRGLKVINVYEVMPVITNKNVSYLISTLGLRFLF